MERGMMQVALQEGELFVEGFSEPDEERRRSQSKRDRKEQSSSARARCFLVGPLGSEALHKNRSFFRRERGRP
jgi:hypothetical protein